MLRSAAPAELRQDEDVLDTWFSSALWPFATLGWPEDTPELRAFYPTDVLVTARDIIYLWVARMIMTGLEFPGQIPFSDVYITSVDPGRPTAGGCRRASAPGSTRSTDRQPWRRRAALRPARDVLQPGRPLLRGQGPAGPRPREQDLERLAPDPAQRRRCRARPQRRHRRGPLDPLAARAHGRVGLRALLDAYDFAHAALELYRFVCSELCDWYLEIVKPRLYDGDARCRRQPPARARAHARARPPADALRHRGDLGYLPGRDGPR